MAWRLQIEGLMCVAASSKHCSVCVSVCRDKKEREREREGSV